MGYVQLGNVMNLPLNIGIVEEEIVLPCAKSI